MNRRELLALIPASAAAAVLPALTVATPAPVTPKPPVHKPLTMWWNHELKCFFAEGPRGEVWTYRGSIGTEDLPG